ncbi:MAG: DNA mismatch repair protein MutS, partial [Planctomycetes bacterium]|nr:DNA mismatch repair protein MutS [Planctomycetota bacterium]
KSDYPDLLLFFRMGDFYEMFYEDAERGAKLLGIALTSRDNGKTPLAGIPHHALETYLAKLVAAGCKVAISEQVEDAKQAKGVVKRAVVRIVTPGTLTDDALLDQTRSNVLAAVWQQGGQAGVASLELSTGQFVVQTCAEALLVDELCRLAPAEILLPAGPHVGRHPLDRELRERSGAATTYRDASDFSVHRAGELLAEQFETRGLEGFGFDGVDLSLQAAGALLAYVRETQMAAATHIRPPRRRDSNDCMTLDATTLRSLEVERTLRTAARDGSLLGAVDRTCNPMGARLLRTWLCYPLRRAEKIRRRQEIVAALHVGAAERQALRKALRDMGDIGRMIGRIGVQRTNPRDLRALGDGLTRLQAMRDALRALMTPQTDELASRLEDLDDPAEQLCTVLRPDAPTAVRGGGIFAEGYDEELDRLRSIGSDGQRWLSEFQTRETARTGIPTLKVGYNKVFGFYIEITHAHRERVPAEYVRKQTVKNAERYITDELKRYESEALSAEARANELEYEAFGRLREQVARHIPALQRAAAALAEIDVLAGWAELARERDYCRPEFVDQPLLEIEAGRHPVVEQSHGTAFVPNDTNLVAGGESLALITGPNMAGKSTYIRQVALLALLAHCGCWVPAKRMRLGPVDRIFTRVGASDELARGQSTFMVEMVETANILHNATRDSLVILDEVGRGTSTFDGLALAWAITEHLAMHSGCRGLFATHYHEMTELADLLEPVFNLNVAVKEFEDQVVFLHRIVRGATGRSYGLHVGKLAGLPRDLLERANTVLNELEKSFSRESQRPALAAVQRRRKKQLRLFEEPEEIVIRDLRELSARPLDPERALECVQRWRELLGIRESAEEAGP